MGLIFYLETCKLQLIPRNAQNCFNVTHSWGGGGGGGVEASN